MDDAAACYRALLKLVDLQSAVPDLRKLYEY
jgi:hypothetical protein